MNATESLSNGNELNETTFNDFVSRLRHHCRGEGVRDHITADALFIVQRKRYIVGIDTDFDPEKCIVDCEASETYYSMEQFISRLDEDSLDYYGLGNCEPPFLEMTESNQWETLETVDSLTVTGFAEEWEYVNAHFTKEAAERFIERKKHDYREGLRVYVESQYYSWEFNAIKNAIMDGRLILSDVGNTND